MFRSTLRTGSDILVNWDDLMQGDALRGCIVRKRKQFPCVWTAPLQCVQRPALLGTKVLHLVTEPKHTTSTVCWHPWVDEVSCSFRHKH